MKGTILYPNTVFCLCSTRCEEVLFFGLWRVGVTLSWDRLLYSSFWTFNSEMVKHTHFWCISFPFRDSPVLLESRFCSFHSECFVLTPEGDTPLSCSCFLFRGTPSLASSLLQFTVSPKHTMSSHVSRLRQVRFTNVNYSTFFFSCLC